MGRRRRRHQRGAGFKSFASGMLNKVRGSAGSGIANVVLNKADGMLRKVIKSKVKSATARNFLNGQLNAAKPFIKGQVKKVLGQKGSGLRQRRRGRTAPLRTKGGLPFVF